MEQLHRTLALVAVAGTVVAIAWALGLAIFRRRLDPRLMALITAIIGTIAVNAVLGVVQLFSGRSPAEQIHLLYAVLALAAVPFARSFVVRAPRRETVLTLAGLVALALFLFRLFTTG